MDGTHGDSFEDLRKVVEALDEMTGEEERRAPKIEETADHLGATKKDVSEWSAGSYNHAVRAAGLIPQADLNPGDVMESYHGLRNLDEQLTRQTVKTKAPTSDASSLEAGLTHTQAVEKLGREKPNRRPVFYGEDGENAEHELRSTEHRYLNQEGRMPTRSETINDSQHPVETSNIKHRFYPEPIRLQNLDIMDSEREEEVAEFWISNYLEEDWENYSDDEAAATLEYRMVSQGVDRREVDAVAQEYERWVNWDRYNF